MPSPCGYIRFLTHLSPHFFAFETWTLRGATSSPRTFANFRKGRPFLLTDMAPCQDPGMQEEPRPHLRPHLPPWPGVPGQGTACPAVHGGLLSQYYTVSSGDPLTKRI